MQGLTIFHFRVLDINIDPCSQSSFHICLPRITFLKVTSHLIKLANAVGPAMARLRVSDEPIDKAIPRLSLFAAVRKVLHEGMKLLGLEPSEKM